MKTNTNLDSGLLNRTAQRDGEKAGFAKYIVLTWQGKEQVVSFPFRVKHADMMDYIREQTPDARAISAGFYFDGANAFWCGGESDSLALKSRPQDRQLLQFFFSSPDRRQWDLTLLTPQGGTQ
jgi:hypothetical protein